MAEDGPSRTLSQIELPQRRHDLGVELAGAAARAARSLSTNSSSCRLHATLRQWRQCGCCCAITRLTAAAQPLALHATSPTRLSPASLCGRRGSGHLMCRVPLCASAGALYTSLRAHTNTRSVCAAGAWPDPTDSHCAVHCPCAVSRACPAVCPLCCVFAWLFCVWVCVVVSAWSGGLNLVDACLAKREQQERRGTAQQRNRARGHDNDHSRLCVLLLILYPRARARSLCAVQRSLCGPHPRVMLRVVQIARTLPDETIGRQLRDGQRQSHWAGASEDSR